MSPEIIGDGVALETLQGLLQAVWNDYHRAKQNGTRVSPDDLLACHRFAGLVLADRCYLANDGVVQEEEGDTSAAVAEFERAACTRLLTRLDLTMQQTDLVKPEWIEAGAAELCRAFRRRLDGHDRGPMGGFA